MNTRNLFKSGFLRAALMLTLAVMTFPTKAWAEKTAYAKLTDNGDEAGAKTLTFKYEEHTVTGDNEWDVTNTGGQTGYDMPGWNNCSESITTVVFEASFATARPTSCFCWFSEFTKLATIEGLSNLNTSSVTDMSGIFNRCTALQSLDLSNFNTSNVTKMYGMFSGCQKLARITFGENFSTSQVTDMQGMFQSCNELTSITFGENFKTDKVQNMALMFSGCSGLTSLDLSHFDTKKVLAMHYMFYGCSGLTSLDLSNFDTSKVGTDKLDDGSTGSMNYMFNGCSKLTSVILPANVKSIDIYTFQNCSLLASITIPASVTKIGKSAFDGCTSLATVYALPSTAPTLDEDAFKNVPTTCKYYVHGTGYDAWSIVDENETIIWAATPGTKVTTATPILSHGGKDYYTAGATATLGFSGAVPSGYAPVYTATMTSDGTDVTSAVISGSTLTMPAYDVKVIATVTDLWGIASGNDGSETNPYVITSPAGLDLLAKMVNGTDGYTADYFTGKYFVLDNDITYSHKEAGTTGADIENNYTAIGNNKEFNVKYFNGSFDGRGHTVSGIRIYKNENYYQGLFGIIGPGCSISHVTLDDARIVGSYYSGGIVGGNSGGKITDCHVNSNVKIIAINHCWRHGGIIGSNEAGAVVSGCTSAAQIIAENGATDISQFGGIVGFNSQSTIQDCLYLGDQVDGNKEVGAIVGTNFSSTIKNCYYTAVGFVGKDGSGNDITLPGGNPAIGYSNVSATATNVGLARTVTLGEGVTLSGTATGYGPASPNTSDVRITSYATAANQLGFALKLETVSGNTTTTTYYSTQGATVTLSYSGDVSTGYAPVYTAKKASDGTDVTSTVISGTTLTMPAYDINVTAEVKQLVAYAVLTDNSDGEGTKTLTFKYEVHTVSGDKERDVSDTGDSTPFYGYHNSITTVVFDESFADARPKSCNGWFKYFSNLTTITGLDNLNTSKVTNMAYMFSGCSGLKSLDLSSFNTSEVTDMSIMFRDCSGLTSLDLSSFNTSKVTNMSYMFYGCIGLKSLDLSSFDTSKVTGMAYMFSGCSGLKSLDLSIFNTRKVTDMSEMFDGCSGLTSLAIGSDFTVHRYGNEFTEDKTNTDNMFNGCTDLKGGMLILTGTTAPDIDRAQNIFSVFTEGKLVTNLTAAQLGAELDNGLYTWRGGTFKSVGNNADIDYLDENGEKKTANAQLITSANGNVEYGTGWYFVAGNVNINGQLMFTGNDYAHIILCDGTKMTVTNTNGRAIYGDKASLTIYGQSTGDNMGSLTATSNGSGIFAFTNTGNSIITINGGQVNATSAGNGSGIFASTYTGNFNITINGGQVNATSAGNGSGIYAVTTVGESHITINGGQVNANSTGNGSGIYASTNTGNAYIAISGGQVNATSAGNGSGIRTSSTTGNANITLGWTKATDFILASSYEGTVKIPVGKYLSKINDDNTTTVWGKADTEEVFDVTKIAGKTLRPAMTIASNQCVDICITDGCWKLLNNWAAYAVIGYDTATGTVTLSEALAGVPEDVPVILVPYGTVNKNILTVASSSEADAIRNSVPTNRSSLFTVGDGEKTMAELIAEATGTSGATGEYMVFTLEDGMFRAASFSDDSKPAKGKCFLVVSKWDVFQMIRNGVTRPDSGARGIPFDLGEATGISLTPSPSPKGEGSEYWYSLDGRKLSKAPTKKGVYIRSGVKVIIK